jgi:hypothetical protein
MAIFDFLFHPTFFRVASWGEPKLLQVAIAVCHVGHLRSTLSKEVVTPTIGFLKTKGVVVSSDQKQAMLTEAIAAYLDVLSKRDRKIFLPVIERERDVRLLRLCAFGTLQSSRSLSYDLNPDTAFLQLTAFWRNEVCKTKHDIVQDLEDTKISNSRALILNAFHDGSLKGMQRSGPKVVIERARIEMKTWSAGLVDDVQKVLFGPILPLSASVVLAIDHAKKDQQVIDSLVKLTTAFAHRFIADMHQRGLITKQLDPFVGMVIRPAPIAIGHAYCLIALACRAYSDLDRFAAGFRSAICKQLMQESVEAGNSLMNDIAQTLGLPSGNTPLTLDEDNAMSDVVAMQMRECGQNICRAVELMQSDDQSAFDGFYTELQLAFGGKCTSDVATERYQAATLPLFADALRTCEALVKKDKGYKKSFKAFKTVVILEKLNLDIHQKNKFRTCLKLIELRFQIRLLNNDAHQ